MAAAASEIIVLCTTEWVVCLTGRYAVLAATMVLCYPTLNQDYFYLQHGEAAPPGSQHQQVGAAAGLRWREI
jgi:hypothetical protein